MIPYYPEKMLVVLVKSMSSTSVNSALEIFSFVCQYIHPSKGVLLVDNLVPPLLQIFDRAPFDTIVTFILINN